MDKSASFFKTNHILSNNALINRQEREIGFWYWILDIGYPIVDIAFLLKCDHRKV
jgi:hypothetical protein